MIVAVVIAVGAMLLALAYFTGSLANGELDVANSADGFLYNTGLSGVSSVANPLNNFFSWLGTLLSPSTGSAALTNPLGVVGALGGAPPDSVEAYFAGIAPTLPGTPGIDQTNTENANPNG